MIGPPLSLGERGLGVRANLEESWAVKKIAQNLTGGVAFALTPPNPLSRWERGL